MRILITLFFSVFTILLFGQDNTLRDEIEQLNRKMEEAFEAGEMDKLASFYLDDAIMLAPQSEPVKGREAIDAYWARTENPISWDLEVIAVSPSEKEIYEHAYYRALETKPPSWRQAGFITETDDRGLVYQLGRSSLKAEYNGKPQTSVVNFILVWKYTDEGYRILVDTYSW